MDPRRATLEDAITAVSEQAKVSGITLTRTKLVKLLYFVDLEAWESFGRTVTGVEWLWHKFGPYSSSIVEAVTSMGAEDKLNLLETTNYYGSTEYRIESAVPAYYRQASSDLTMLIRGVLREYGRMTPTQIGDASYETAPMRSLIKRSGVRGDRIEFESPEPCTTEVSAVADRYRDILGGPQEDEGDVAGGLREEMAGLDEARRAANSALMPH